MKMVNLVEILERKSKRLGRLVDAYCDSFAFDYFVLDKGNDSESGDSRIKFISNVIKVDSSLSTRDDNYMVKLSGIEIILLSIVDYLKEELSLAEKKEDDYSSLDIIEIDANIYFLNEVLRNEF